MERLIQLLNESVETLEGPNKAVAMGNLATVYRMLGDYRTAVRMYERVKEVFAEQGDRQNLAATYHQMGIVYQHQGNYAEAQAMYEQSLAIKRELGDKSGAASSLSQLGVLYQL